MMRDILRNMARRKTRTGLTILGIVIGLFTLTVMGAMAKKINQLVGGGLAFYGDHGTVTQAGTAMGAMPIATARAADLQRVPGVGAVVPEVQMMLKTDSGAGDRAGGWPTRALDSKLSEQVIGLMRELNQETGQTFVIVSHDPIVAAQTDRTIHLADGRVERDTPRVRDGRHLAAVPTLAAAGW